MTAENLEANLLFAEFAREYSKRSFWSLGTEPVFIDTVIYWGDNLTIPLILYNHGDQGSISLKALSSETPEWLTATPENLDTALTGADSLILEIEIISENLSLGGNYFAEVQVISHNNLTSSFIDTTLIPVQAEVLCSGARLPGDVDGSGNWSMPDVIYLVNYVFDKDRPATGCIVQVVPTGSNPVPWVPKQRFRRLRPSPWTTSVFSSR